MPYNNCIEENIALMCFLGGVLLFGLIGSVFIVYDIFKEGRCNQENATVHFATGMTLVIGIVGMCALCF